MGLSVSGRDEEAFVGNSFIHIEHFYSVSSRKLLRGAPNSSTTKESSFNVRTEADDKVLGNRRNLEGSYPGRGSNHGECRVLPKGGTGKREKGEQSDRVLIALRRGQQSSRR